MESGKTSSRMTSYHWKVIGSCMLLIMSSVGLGYNSYGVFLTPLAEALNIGYAAVSFHTTIYYLSYGVLTPLAMKLIDKGISYRKLAAFGVIVVTLSTGLMSIAPSIWFFYVLAVLKGLGYAFLNTPILTMILGNWFRKNLGIISGVTLSFSGLGGALFSPLMTWVIGDYGYQTAYIVSAVILLLTGIPAMLFLHVTPEEIGQKPYEEAAPASKEARKEVLKESEKEAGKESVNEAGKEAGKEAGNEVPRSIFLCVLFGYMFYTATSSMASHLANYAVDIGVGSAVGAMLLSIINIFNIIGKFIIGSAKDRFGSFPSSMVMIVLSLLGNMIFFLEPASRTVLSAGALLYGLMYSFSAVGITFIVRDVFGDKKYGSTYSLILAIGTPILAFVTTGYGVLYDITGSYRLAWFSCVICIIISMVLFIRVWIWKKHRQIGDGYKSTL